MQHAAKARDMVVEGRIGSLGGHHRIAFAHQQTNEIAQQPVDPFADDDVFGRDAVQFGQRRAQFYAFGIAVFPHLGFCHGRDGAGRRSKDVFIGAKPRFEGAA